MGILSRDLRFGLRLLGKSPGHTVAAVLALALGIGLSTAMFSIVYGVLFRGLPFDESERILHLENARPAKDQPSLEVPVRDYLDWRQRQTSFEEMAAYDTGSLTLSGREKPERFDGAFVTAGLLRVLRVQPILGRGFVPGEDAPDAEPVVLLGYGVWKSRYGGDPRIVGRPVRIDGVPGTVIGVMPQGFGFPETEQAWTNLRLDPLREEPGRGRTLDVIGRLQPGVTIEQARAEMEGIARALAAEHPETHEGLEARAVPLLEEYLEGPVRRMLSVMLGACLFVLLLACTNVASLQMARASRRTRELATRSALGAKRERLVAQLLVESVLISLLGAVPGVLLAVWAVDLFNVIVAESNPPFWVHIAVDHVSLAFALGITGLAALASGLAPALQASRPDVTDVLKDEGRGSSGLRLGSLSRLVVVGEVAVSCLLLIGTGLTVKSVVRLRTVELGFEEKGILTARVALFESTYPEEADRVAFFDEVLSRLREHPEAAAVTATTLLPGNAGRMRHYAAAGRFHGREEDHPLTWFGSASPGYFETFGIPLRRGRNFGHLDRADSLPVVIVNESFARAVWPGEDPLGRQIRLFGSAPGDGEGQPWRTVVGVVADSQMSIGTRHAPETKTAYVPLAQDCPASVTLAVRTRQVAPKAFTGNLRETVAAIDADLPIHRVYRLEEILARNRFFSNVFGSLFAIFGLSALLLASVGIYGVIAFSVQQRTQEIGIRLALGARKETVLGLILRQGMRQLGVGLSLGLVLAWPAVKVLRRFLFEVQPNDPGTFATVSLVLALVAFVACWFPARRASRTDPLIAIRYE